MNIAVNSTHSLCLFGSCSITNSADLHHEDVSKYFIVKSWVALSYCCAMKTAENSFFLTAPWVEQHLRLQTKEQFLNTSHKHGAVLDRIPTAYASKQFLQQCLTYVDQSTVTLEIISQAMVPAVYLYDSQLAQVSLGLVCSRVDFIHGRRCICMRRCSRHMPVRPFIFP